MESTQTVPSASQPAIPLDAPCRLNALLNRIAELAPDTDCEGAFPERAFSELADAGLLAITLPGYDLDFTGKNSWTIVFTEANGFGHRPLDGCMKGTSTPFTSSICMPLPSNGQRGMPMLISTGGCSASGIHRRKTVYALTK